MERVVSFKIIFSTVSPLPSKALSSDFYYSSIHALAEKSNNLPPIHLILIINLNLGGSFLNG